MVKHRLIIRVGKKWIQFDLVDVIASSMKISKTEAKRLIESDAVEIFKQ